MLEKDTTLWKEKLNEILVDAKPHHFQKYIPGFEIY